jgi:hypothetical protein
MFFVVMLCRQFTKGPSRIETNRTERTTALFWMRLVNAYGYEGPNPFAPSDELGPVVELGGAERLMRGGGKDSGKKHTDLQGS